MMNDRQTSKTTRLMAAGLAAGLALGTTALPAWAGQGGPGGPGGDRGGALPIEALTSAEAATLTFMREEEKLARDVYLGMDALWQALPFANIAVSEQSHMDAVKRMLDKYGLPDPAAPEIGVFLDPELQALYDELMARGERSYLDALQVGALIEEVDIEDLQNASDETARPDLDQVYENLMRGSRNHLRAFVSQIEVMGVVYAAQYLDQATVDAIVDSPMERGGR